MSTGDPERSRATEQTPLLREVEPVPVDQEEEQTERAPPDYEVSVKELSVILGSIWLGVFLAALGSLHYSALCEFTGSRRCRFNHCCDTLSTDLVFIQLFLSTLLAGSLLFNLKCRVPTIEWPID